MRTVFYFLLDVVTVLFIIGMAAGGALIAVLLMTGGGALK